MQTFEKKWQKRFESFAKGTSDAQIAGWSETGLQARLYFFNQAITQVSGLWVDAGSGAGTYARLLASKGAEVVGFDYSWLSLKKAKQKEGHYICANAYRIPIKPNRANGCLCFGVLQALDNEQALIREISGLLKPNGELWIDGLNQYCVVHILKQLKNKLTGKARHLRYTSPWQIKKKLELQGFQSVKLYWAPILPGKLSKLNKLLLNQKLQWLLQLLGFMTAFFSHSYYLHGIKQES